MIRPFPKLRLSVQPKIRRLPKRDAVTIGLGFVTTEGVVLCSDRQHTSAAGFKFEKCKIMGIEHVNGTSIMLSYAGEPEAAEVIFTKIREQLGDGLPHVEGDNRDPIERIWTYLDYVYASPFTKGLETLVSVRVPGDVSPRLYRTRERKVVTSHGRSECIGCGDSSVIRFLSERLANFIMSRDEAEIIGAYLVSVANRYADGCGGGPDIYFQPKQWPKEWVEFRPRKRITDKKQQFDSIENKIGEELRRLLLE